MPAPGVRKAADSASSRPKRLASPGSSAIGTPKRRLSGGNDPRGEASAKAKRRLWGGAEKNRTPGPTPPKMTFGTAPWNAPKGNSSSGLRLAPFGANFSFLTEPQWANQEALLVQMQQKELRSAWKPVSLGGILKDAAENEAFEAQTGDEDENETLKEFFEKKKETGMSVRECEESADEGVAAEEEGVAVPNVVAKTEKDKAVEKESEAADVSVEENSFVEEGILD